MQTVLVAGALLVGYMLYNKSKQQQVAMGGGGPVFMMFYRDSCPHCVAAKPEFNKLRATKRYQTAMVDLADERNRPLAEQFGVEGIPHFVLLKSDGSRVNYTGERTMRGFEQFLQTNYK